MALILLRCFTGNHYRKKINNPRFIKLVIMTSKDHIRVFVDTNVDASVLLIESGATTIGELKRTYETWQPHLQLFNKSMHGDIDMLVAVVVVMVVRFANCWAHVSEFCVSCHMQQSIICSHRVICRQDWGAYQKGISWRWWKDFESIGEQRCREDQLSFWCC